MGQININPSSDRGDGSSAAAAGITMITMVIVLGVVIVLAVLAYGAFAGSWFSAGSTGTRPGNTTTINVQQPSAPSLQSPAAAPSR
jgi:flagellar basal body-associated protein FliL